MAETKALCEKAAPRGTRITTYLCDISDEAQVLAFRDAVRKQHATDLVHLVFNNAGIADGGSLEPLSQITPVAELGPDS